MKISALPVDQVFDADKDRVFVESEGSNFQSTFSKIVERLDIKNKEINDVEWHFLRKQDRFESFLEIGKVSEDQSTYKEDGKVFNEVFKGQLQEEIDHTVELSPSGKLVVRFRIAGFAGASIDSGCRRVLMCARVKNVKMTTKYQDTLHANIFDASGKRGLVFFVLENIKDPIHEFMADKQSGFHFGNASPDYDSVQNYLFNMSGWNTVKGIDRIKNEFRGLKNKIKNNQHVVPDGPLTKKGLIPRYNKETGEYENIEEIDHVTALIENTSSTESGFLYSMKILASSR